MWSLYYSELGISYTELNNTFATNCAGLAVGCVIFIPFALKFGRRPVYIISTFITFGMAIWQAALHTYGEMLATQVISGLSGAVSETLVQMTVADVFFVHQRGTMNGVYLLMVTAGTFLAPVASGYIANSQGWRWLYWWCTIFIGISTLLFLFFYEETKYIPSGAEARGHVVQHAASEDDKTISATRNQSVMSVDNQRIDYSIPMRTYRQRFAFTTTTRGPFSLIFRHTYQPFWILFTFPAAAYTAIQYGSILAWFSVLATSEATYFPLPPYNFGPIGVGLLNLPAFLGCILGAIWGGPLSDWSILFFAKRNKGIYEPEMRLWLAMFPVFVGPAGLFLYGYSLADVSRDSPFRFVMLITTSGHALDHSLRGNRLLRLCPHRTRRHEPNIPLRLLPRNARRCTRRCGVRAQYICHDYRVCACPVDRRPGPPWYIHQCRVLSAGSESDDGADDYLGEEGMLLK